MPGKRKTNTELSSQPEPKKAKTPTDDILDTAKIQTFYFNYQSQQKLVNKTQNQRQVDSDYGTKLSHELPIIAATNQHETGTCWIHAMFNLLRYKLMASNNFKDIKFSVAYYIFWDKFERANLFFSKILANASAKITSEENQLLLSSPLSPASIATDGGVSATFINLYKKYGIIPENVMPHTTAAKNTDKLNAILNHHLRQGAWKLRKATRNRLQLRDILLQQVFNILSSHLGLPPEKSTKFCFKTISVSGRKTELSLSPLEFTQQINFNPDSYVALSHTGGKLYPAKSLMVSQVYFNVIGGEQHKFFVLSKDIIEASIKRSLAAKETIPVDVDEKLLKPTIYGDIKLDPAMSKEDRLLYKDLNYDSQGHRMLIIGFNYNSSRKCIDMCDP